MQKQTERMQQRHKTVYFVGKILNQKEDPDDNAKTFAFSKTERASLAKQLRGIPVQMEHEDALKVGEITNAWRDAKDQFWVYGKLNGNDLKSTFAKHAVQKKGSNKAYYGGLSLQHVHRQYKDGSSEKAPIEVSLVVEPRRRNCDIVWVSSKEPTKQENYIGTVQAASSRQNIDINTNNMSAESATPAVEAPAEVQAAPAAPVEQTPAAPAEASESAPTGLQLNEQVYSQMAELYEKDKKQQEELAKLREQLKEHQSQQEQAKQAKLAEDAAKGRALMSTMLEHMRDLLGANDEVQQLEPQLMPLMQSNPNEMNQLLEVVAKASKKYKNQEMELKSARNNLQEKELELKFQKLIKQHGMSTTTEVASRKRSAPAQAAAVAKIQEAAKPVQQSSRQAINPYLRTAQAAQRSGRRGRQPAMNKELLNAFMSNRSGSARQSMAKLANSMQQTMKERSMYY